MVKKTWCHSSTNPNITANATAIPEKTPEGLPVFGARQIGNIFSKVKEKCHTTLATLEDYEEAQRELTRALLYSEEKWRPTIQAMIEDLNFRLEHMLFRAAENSIKKDLTSEPPMTYTRNGD